MRLDGPGWPDFELRDFATALGGTGRAELARLVDERSVTAQPDMLGRAPFGIRILREQLAEISGDVDHYVAVVAQDLYATAQYLKIVDALRTAGRTDEAEDWAYRGLSERGNPTDLGMLRDTYVELLFERGANDEALAVRNEVFDLQRLIEQRLANSGDKHRYARSIELIRRLREACRAADNEHGFADLRERHKRKTSFLAKLDRAERDTAT